MQYGFILPDMTDVTLPGIAALGAQAEASGWDAVFFWDADWTLSPWVVMSALAMATERVRLGAILHPLAWRSPWLFARDTATLDQLSNGRLIITVGLGAIHEGDAERGRTRFGAPVERKLRAQLLDEHLEITNGLWSGQPFSFNGQHHQFDAFQMQVVPVQQPRIPIWAVGVWGTKSMERVARCDGMLVAETASAEEIGAIAAFAAEQRTATTPFDIVMEADTRGQPAEQARAKAQAAQQAGATWWVESMWSPNVTMADAQARIAQGPPRA